MNVLNKLLHSCCAGPEADDAGIKHIVLAQALFWLTPLKPLKI